METSGNFEIAGTAITLFLQLIVLFIGTLGAIDCALATLGNRNEIIKALGETLMTFLRVVSRATVFFFFVLATIVLTTILMKRYGIEYNQARVGEYVIGLFFTFLLIGFVAAIIGYIMLRKSNSVERESHESWMAVLANPFSAEKLASVETLPPDSMLELLKRGLNKIGIALALQTVTILMSLGQTLTHLVGIFEK